ncbi:MAG: Putative NAD(P)-dependent oxidoreductase EC-YbbO [uncultured Sulfurovum sp.]|uniref:NAD(P)-dependent oxidoreductase EC-YbbO n=1 Tax=uncultured Sulfurovum sp. TaxID=269237 RepID=A0A6S6T2I6_9BACT|nr:MAG: Putative NAD(P)-dependent oxidoreductase EC-YbbO [uncultured Sulfurovum sp.]
MQNIVITGCSTGIGLATAQYLKEQGYKVYPTVKDAKDLPLLQTMGFENVMTLDVQNPQEISQVINFVLNEDAKIDTWFNNAGFGQAGALEDIKTDVLKEQFNTNVFGLHECTRQVIPIMRKQGYGKIIQHSSVLGLISLFGRGAYNASKYAIEGLTDTLRLELKGTNIYPVLLNTGPISSSFRKNAMQKLKENVDTKNSVHAKYYQKALSAEKSKVPFNEEAIAVAKIVHTILLTKKPKPRYYITKATYLLGYLKRILSTNALDKLLRKLG